MQMLRLRSLLDPPAVALPLTVALQLAVPSQAAAAPVRYTLQIGWATEARFILDGDRLEELGVTLPGQTCTDGAVYGADDAWNVSLPAGTGVRLVGGRIRLRGQAPSAYYPGGGAGYAVTGKIASDDHAVTGTIRLANGWDPFVSGCSASYRFVAIPTPRPASGWGVPDGRDFTSPSVSFDYRSRTVRRLVVRASFDCGEGPDPSVDSADLSADPSVIRTTSAGRWSLDRYVLDGYGKIVRLEMTGRIDGARAGGRIEITEPRGLLDVGGESCRGDYAWSAARYHPG
jgi:hypothetical protein